MGRSYSQHNHIKLLSRGRSHRQESQSGAKQNSVSYEQHHERQHVQHLQRAQDAGEKGQQPARRAL